MEKSFRNGREWYNEIPEFNPDEPRLNPRQIKGLYIDGKYLYSTKLTNQEKLLMAYINLLDQEDHCYASNKHLAGFLNCSEKTIANMLVILRKKKFIKNIFWDGERRVIKCI